MRAEAFMNIRIEREKADFGSIQESKKGNSKGNTAPPNPGHETWMQPFQKSDRGHWVAKAIRATLFCCHHQTRPNIITVPIQWFCPTHSVATNHGTAGLQQQANWNHHYSELPLSHHDALDLHKHTSIGSFLSDLHFTSTKSSSFTNCLISFGLLVCWLCKLSQYMLIEWMSELFSKFRTAPQAITLLFKHVSRLKADTFTLLKSGIASISGFCLTPRYVDLTACLT